MQQVPIPCSDSVRRTPTLPPEEEETLLCREMLGRADLLGFTLCGKQSTLLACSKALFHSHNNIVTVSTREHGNASISTLPLP